MNPKHKVVIKWINDQSKILYTTLPLIPRENEMIIKDGQFYRVESVIYNLDNDVTIIHLNEKDNAKADNE